MNELLSLDSLLGHVIYWIDLTARLYTRHLLTIIDRCCLFILCSEDYYFMQLKIQKS